MNVLWKLGAYSAALAATFGAAYGIGNAVDPIADEPVSHAQHRASASPTPGDGHGDHSKAGGGGHGDHAKAGAAATVPGGLQVSEGGYSIDLKTPRLKAGRSEDIRFLIRDQKGRAVTDYEPQHDKELHLIVASRDLLTFRHLHPTRAADGTWSTPVDLPTAGDYRVFADFKPAKKDKGLTLGTDLAVSGTYKPAELPEPAAAASVDGYTVTLTGDLRAATASELTLSVNRDGRPVTDLQPYLGAYGHLVALRAGDLAYLHVHPNGEPGDGETKPGPDVSFSTTAPSAGTYRLFLDFKHNGTVHTAAFTVRTGAPAKAQPAASAPAEQHDSRDHQH
jgi:hypothetical protein